VEAVAVEVRRINAESTQPVSDILSVATVARAFDRHPDTIKRWCRRGDLVYRIGPTGTWFIRREDFERFKAALPKGKRRHLRIA
jgi:predicted site-specific integrase-resolvase